MLDISSGIHDISSLRWELAGCLLLAWVIVYLALWRGIKSIGKVCTDGGGTLETAANTCS